MDNKLAFLKNVLGADGAKALQKSISKLPSLENVVLLYTLNSWLASVGDYEGEIPGISQSNLELNKSEDLYSGNISVADFKYNFEKSSQSDVIAVLGMVVGLESFSFNKELKKVNISELGKNIDSLVKFELNKLQKAALEELEKAKPLALARHQLLNAPKPGHTTKEQGGMVHPPAKMSGTKFEGKLPSEMWGVGPAADKKAIAVEVAKHPEKYANHIDGAAHHYTAAKAAKQLAEYTQLPAERAHYEAKSQWHHQMGKLHENHAGSLFTPDPMDAKHSQLYGNISPQQIAEDTAAFNQQMGGNFAINHPGIGFGKTKNDIKAHMDTHYGQQNPMMLIGKAHPIDTQIKNTSPAQNAFTSVKIQKSELYNTCDTCGEPEFKGTKFVGCLCLKDLAKNELEVVEHPDHFLLKFGKDWKDEEDSITTLLKIIKPERI